MLMLPIIAALGAASPTYLSCTVDQGGTPLAVDIVADETNRRATVSLPTGRVVERIAVFSPTAVRIEDDQSVWHINRVDLSFKRIVTISAEREYLGKCEVKPSPEKRAF